MKVASTLSYPARVRSACRVPALTLALALSACGGSIPTTLGPVDGGLPPCPSTPNCVHTGDRHPDGTAPMVLAPEWRDADIGDLWLQVEEAVASLPRTEIFTLRPGYLHAESTSRIFRFVDDLEVYLDAPRGELVVRSASRVGRSDMGVNGARVEALRDAFRERGLLGGVTLPPERRPPVNPATVMEST